MLALTVKFEVSSELKAGFAAAPKKLNKCTRIALNTGIAQCKTVATTHIRKMRNVRLKDVNKSLSIKKATVNNLQADLNIYGRPIPFLLKTTGDVPAYQGTRVLAGRGRRKKGASRPRSPVQVEPIPGRRRILKRGWALDFTTEGGKILARVGRSRLPTRLLFGPSLTTSFVDKQNENGMVMKARAVVPGEIERQAQLEFRGEMRA